MNLTRNFILLKSSFKTLFRVFQITLYAFLLVQCKSTVSPQGKLKILDQENSVMIAALKQVLQNLGANQQTEFIPKEYTNNLEEEDLDSKATSHWCGVYISKKNRYCMSFLWHNWLHPDDMANEDIKDLHRSFISLSAFNNITPGKRKTEDEDQANQRRRYQIAQVTKDYTTRAIQFFNQIASPTEILFDFFHTGTVANSFSIFQALTPKTLENPILKEESDDKRCSVKNKSNEYIFRCDSHFSINNEGMYPLHPAKSITGNMTGWGTPISVTRIMHFKKRYDPKAIPPQLILLKFYTKLTQKDFRSH